MIKFLEQGLIWLGIITVMIIGGVMLAHIIWRLVVYVWSTT